MHRVLLRLLLPLAPELAGQFGRRWVPSHLGIDSADLAIAGTTVLVDARLLTRKTTHFPMLPGLTTPY